MSFSKYVKYKESGIAWLGSVPSDWGIAPIKAVASCNDEVLPESTDSESVIEYVEISGVEEGRGITETETLAFGAAPSRARRVVRHGDVLISTVRTYLRAIATVTNPPENLVASTGFAAIRPRSVDAGFLGYLLHAEYLMSEVIARSVGISYPAINASELMRLKAPIPSLQEQRAISAFLDSEAAKIDALVEEQKRLIELLKEKRQAVISQAVTRGLNPNVPMKDSGVPWLGEIPAHWQIQRGRFLFGQSYDPPEDGDGVVTAFRDGQVTLRENRRTDGFTVAVMEVGYQHVRVGDLVIHGMDAFAGAIGVSESDGKCTPEYSVLRPRMAGLSNHYYAAALRLMALRNFIYVICPSVRERAPRFRYESFKDVWLPVPPANEQAEIMGHVSAEVRRLNELAREAESLISLATERRSGLISAAVTGKIDVRGLVQVQPKAVA